MTNTAREQEDRPSTNECAALTMTSGAHFVHDGMADSLYVLLPVWAQAFGLNYTQVGSLKMAFSAAMALFQMPAGLMAERLGERAMLGIGTVIAGLAFAAMALADGYLKLFLFILIVGLGASVQHPLSSSIISRTFVNARRRAALGIYNFFGDLGKMTIAFAIATVAGSIGWRASVIGYGWIVAAVGIGLFAVLARFSLGNADGEPSPHAAPGHGEAKRVGWGITDKRGFALLSAIHLIDSASRTGALTMLPFLLIGKGASSATVGLALALLFAGGAMGKLACGLLADRLGPLRTVAFTELATAGALFAALPAPIAMALALMPLLGIALNGTSSVLYGTITDFVRSDRQARAFGAFYTLGSFAGGSAPLIFGATSDWLGLWHAFAALGVLVLMTLPLVAMMRPHLSGANSQSV
jgi:MFS transporter, FSR family, fosmidomycin resistance protein